MTHEIDNAHLILLAISYDQPSRNIVSMLFECYTCIMIFYCAFVFFLSNYLIASSSPNGLFPSIQKLYVDFL